MLDTSWSLPLCFGSASDAWHLFRLFFLLARGERIIIDHLGIEFPIHAGAKQKPQLAERKILIAKMKPAASCLMSFLITFIKPLWMGSPQDNENVAQKIIASKRVGIFRCFLQVSDLPFDPNTRLKYVNIVDWKRKDRKREREKRGWRKVEERVALLLLLAEGSSKTE